MSKYRTEIDRGLGKTILPALLSELDDPRWEDAFWQHLRRLSTLGEIAKDVIAVCAREKVTSSRSVRAITARHIFAR